MQHDLRRELVHLADHFGSGLRGVDDDHVVRGGSPERDALRREGVLRPEPAAPGMAGHAILAAHHRPGRVAHVHVRAHGRMQVAAEQHRTGLVEARVDRLCGLARRLAIQAQLEAGGIGRVEVLETRGAGAHVMLPRIVVDERAPGAERHERHRGRKAHLFLRDGDLRRQRAPGSLKAGALSGSAFDF